MDYTTADIRRFLNKAFTDEELTALCFDYFPEVHNNFTAGMTKGQRIQLLIEYCQRQEIIPNLLAVIQKARPTQWPQSGMPPSPPPLEPPVKIPERDLGEKRSSFLRVVLGIIHRAVTDREVIRDVIAVILLTVAALILRAVLPGLTGDYLSMVAAIVVLIFLVLLREYDTRPKEQRKRVIVVGIVLLLLAVAIAYAFRPTPPDQPTMPKTLYGP